MDGAMAHDKSTLDAEDSEVRPEPTLSLPTAGSAPSSFDADNGGEPPFQHTPPMQLLPPPLPGAAAAKPTEDAPTETPPPAAELPVEEKSLLDDLHPEAKPTDATPRRRMARRRAAGPSRNRIAANDDGPSIGGLIFALQQKPSNAPFKFATVASIVWAAIGVAFALASIGTDAPVLGLLDLVTRPTTFLTIAAIVVPIAMLWLMALLAWRTEELRLRSSTMTEVAIRLAEPDRLAEQNAASLGQAVRRQVGFMNDAVSRALGRAGELEAMVHNEVSVLERSYEDNERKIRGLISELSGERHALVNTSDRVSESLMRLGSEIPTLIEKLSDQQVKLAKVIEGAGENLTNLETSLATSVGSLETAVGGRTEQLQNVLENYTSALGTALGSRAEQMQITFDSQLQQLDSSLGNRTENLQTVFEEYARALDAALANRAQALDYQLVERTRSLDEAFGERLRLFDELIMRSTSAIDTAVVDKTQALTNALDAHAISFRETIGKQATDLDESADAWHQLGAPCFREHHPPVDQGDGRPRRPVRPAEEHLREPAEPDQRRHRPLREPGPADHEGGQRARDRQLQNRQDAAEPSRRADADAGSPVRQGRRVLDASSATTPPPWKAPFRKPTCGPAASWSACARTPAPRASVRWKISATA